MKRHASRCFFSELPIHPYSTRSAAPPLCHRSPPARLYGNISAPSCRASSRSPTHDTAIDVSRRGALRHRKTRLFQGRVLSIDQFVAMLCTLPRFRNGLLRFGFRGVAATSRSVLQRVSACSVYRSTLAQYVNSKRGGGVASSCVLAPDAASCLERPPPRTDGRGSRAAG